jgi:hypothetical protein
MEIKYTIEILTKDIQDIEKLVANIQNSPNGSTLELDLALSKLRNVYDILTMIRTDMSLSGKIPKVSAEPQLAETPAPEAEPPVAETPAPEAEPPVPEPVPPVVQPPVAEAPTVAQKEPKITHGHTGTIAEKFTAESSINENLAGTRDPDKESKLLGKPIDSISRNIGINDRFLIIRELFDGNSDGFVKLIEELDNAGDLLTASQLLESKFEQAREHEGISILTNLVKRRYNRN